MAVGLVPHVPHNAVVGRGKHVVQRHSQLHGTKARSQMPRIMGTFLDYQRTQLAANLRQLLDWQLPQVLWRVYMLKKCFFFLHFGGEDTNENE